MLHDGWFVASLYPFESRKEAFDTGFFVRLEQPREADVETDRYAAFPAFKFKCLEFTAAAIKFRFI